MFVWLLRVYKPTMDGILLLPFRGLNPDEKLRSPLAHTQPPLRAVLLPSTWVAGLPPHPKDHDGGTGSLFPSGDQFPPLGCQSTQWQDMNPRLHCSGAGVELVLLPAAVYLNTASL